MIATTRNKAEKKNQGSGKGVFFRVENFFNFAQRKLLCLFCREKFCKKIVYSGIELICEFAKHCSIVNKTCI